MSIAVGMGPERRCVPIATKKAMRAAHLLGKVIKAHFDDNLCEQMTEKSFDWRAYSLNILDNLLLVGGIPRDILLGTEVKDIDITFNLRELTKIQLNHLRKYHSTKQSQLPSCKCAYWQHYLNRFSPDNEAAERENQAQSNEMIKFHNCSYIFNARYFTDIVAESPLLRGKVTIKDLPEHGFISCTITDSLLHEAHDLKGQKFEFTDTFDPEAVLSIQKLAQQRSMSAADAHPPHQQQQQQRGGGPKQRTRWKSLALLPNKIDFAAEFAADFRTLELEIYPIKVRSKLRGYDFSINTAIIPLSSITEFCDSEDEVNIAIWFWEYIVENALDDVEAIKDITVHRVLRVPQPGKELDIIAHHPTTYHFWRTVELMIRLPNFFIDEALIEAHTKDYARWLRSEYFAEKTNSDAFIRKFREIVTVYCKGVRDVRAMLHTLEVLRFNDRFTRLLRSDKRLNGELMTAIQMTDNQQILVIFSSYGYPFLFGLNTMEKKQYAERYGDERDRDEAGDGDAEEVKELREANERLQRENERLEAEVQGLRENKVVLVRNAAQAIDELRRYLTQCRMLHGRDQQ